MLEDFEFSTFLKGQIKITIKTTGLIYGSWLSRILQILIFFSIKH